MNEKKPQFIERVFWNPDRVRSCCIRHGWYTEGSVSEYEAMLKMAGEAPTVEQIYKMACDIVAHSEDQTVRSVMYLLRNEAVRTAFDEVEA